MKLTKKKLREIIAEIKSSKDFVNERLKLSKQQLKGMIRRAKRAGAKGYDIVLSLSRDLSVSADEIVSALEKNRLTGMTEGILNEAKYKQTYKSITARDKDIRRIWGSQIGHPRVTVRSWSEIEKTGRMKTAYIEVDGDKAWVDAYKKIAFSGKGNFGDVIKFVRKNESINESTASWEKSLKQAIELDKLKMLSKKDKKTLMRIAKLMKKEAFDPEGISSQQKISKYRKKWNKLAGSSSGRKNLPMLFIRGRWYAWEEGDRNSVFVSDKRGKEYEFKYRDIEQIEESIITINTPNKTYKVRI